MFNVWRMEHEIESAAHPQSYVLCDPLTKSRFMLADHMWVSAWQRRNIIKYAVHVYLNPVLNKQSFVLYTCFECSHAPSRVQRTSHGKICLIKMFALPMDASSHLRSHTHCSWLATAFAYILHMYMRLRGESKHTSERQRNQLVWLEGLLMYTWNTNWE